jgi:hypothetical protein
MQLVGHFRVAADESTIGGGANYMKIGYFCARAVLNPAFDIFQPNRDEVYIR